MTVILYAYFTLSHKVPVSQLHKYHASSLSVDLIRISFVVIAALIWYAGFYGYYKLSNYTRLIRLNKDGKEISKLSKGIFILALWLPITSTTSALMRWLVFSHPSWLTLTTVIQDYISLLFPLFGFIMIGYGSRGLSEIAKHRPSFRATNVLALLVILVGVFYGYLVATTSNRLNNAYQLPVSVVLATLVVPYIYAWFLGFLSVYEIFFYQKKIAGVIYKKYWKFLAIGVGGLIGSSIILQYVTTLSLQLNNLSLNALLIVVYAILLAMSVGFVFISVGARKLQKIEEV